MKLRSVVALMALVALLGTTYAAKADELINRVVAVVGDEPITAVELEKSINSIVRRIKMMQDMGRQAQVPSPRELRHMALNQLIDEKLFRQEVDRLEMKVSDAELDGFIERLKTANNMSQEEFIARLNQTGMTPDEYRENLRNDILKRRLVSREVKSKVIISDKQVDDYLAEHPDIKNVAGQVTLRALFLKLPENATAEEDASLAKKAEELHKKVVDGADFASLCKDFSEGPGAGDGGEVGPLNPNDLLPEMRKAIESLKPGELSGVLRIPTGFVFMRLLTVSGDGGPGVAKLRAEVREELENEILDERFNQWLKDLHSKTYVRIID